ncbi:hypothetical protein JCM15519_24280 [Fundidesulfovibrio butyratiphilus]
MRSPFCNVGDGVHVSIEVKQLVHLMIEMDKLGFFSHLKQSGENMFDPESLGKFMETFLNGDKFSVNVELNTNVDTPSDNLQ